MVGFDMYTFYWFADAGRVQKECCCFFWRTFCIYRRFFSIFIKRTYVFFSDHIVLDMILYCFVHTTHTSYIVAY